MVHRLAPILVTLVLAAACGSSKGAAPNRLPSAAWLVPGARLTVATGGHAILDFEASDPDLDAHYTITVNAIEIASGAAVGVLRIEWDTTDLAAGEHAVVLHVADDDASAEAVFTLVVDGRPGVVMFGLDSDRLAPIVENAPMVGFDLRSSDLEGPAHMTVALEDAVETIVLASDLALGDHRIDFSPVGVRVGNYRLVATIDDGINAPVRVESAGFVRLTTPDDLVHRGGGTKTVHDRSVLPDGSMLAVGVYTGLPVFGPGEVNETSLNLQNGTSAFMARFDPDGSVAWARRPWDGGVEAAFALVPLDDGDFLVGGKYATAVFFGNNEEGVTYVEATENGSEALRVRYDGNGVFESHLTWGGPLSNEVESLARPAEDVVVMGGYFTTAMDFGGTTLTSNGDRDAYVAAHDDAGSLLWVRQIGGAARDVIEQVAPMPDGGVVVMGHFVSPTIDLGGGHSATNTGGGMGMFLVRYDADGNVVWARTGTTSRIMLGSDLDTWPDGSVVATGVYNWTGATIDGVELPGPSTSDGWVARWRADGTLDWATHIGTDRLGRVQTTVTYADGSFVVEGTLSADWHIDGQVLQPGPEGRFAVRFAADGTILWTSTP